VLKFDIPPELVPKLLLAPVPNEVCPGVEPKPVDFGAEKPPPPTFEPKVFLVPTFELNDFGAVKPPPPKEPPLVPPIAPAPAED